MGVEGNFATVAVLLRAFLNHRADRGFDDVQQQLVGEPVAHHVVHHAGEHTVDTAARRHLAVELLLDARGNTLVLQRYLGQRDEALVGGANLGACGGGLGRLTVGIHQRLLLLHKLLSDERQEGEVELGSFGLERAVLIEQGSAILREQIPRLIACRALVGVLVVPVAIGCEGGKLLQANVHLKRNGNLLSGHYFSSSTVFSAWVALSSACLARVLLSSSSCALRRFSACRTWKSGVFARARTVRSSGETAISRPCAA